jgi:hypothetical protein
MMERLKMAKTALPQPTFPEMKLPKFDLDALFALHRANVAAVREAQDVLIEAAHAIAKVQKSWVEDTFANAKSTFTGREPKAPKAAYVEVKAATEKALAVVKQGVDLGTAAQRKVVDLMTRRAVDNVEEFKTLAAA